MRRVWFKEEMKEAILSGRKTATTRDHPLPLGQVLAVSGSRFKAKLFAILEIQDRIPTRRDVVIPMFYQEEGFESIEEMESFCKKEKLLQENKDYYYHKFKLVKKI